MTVQQLYEFDIKGYIVVENVLAPWEIELFREILEDVKGAKGTGKFSFFDKHPCFAELMVRKPILQIISTLCGEYFRFDHALGLRMTKGLNQRQGLHGGNGSGQGTSLYMTHNGKVFNGLVKVLYSLVDVVAGDGGFVCIPGSHKSGIDFRPENTSSPLVVNPAMKGGDVLIFTEALVHGSKAWNGNIERFALLYSYCPGYMAWKNPSTIDHYKPLLTSELQKAVCRPPFVGSYNERELDEFGFWPKDRVKPVNIE